MMTNERSPLRDTASNRALASLILKTSIEIATRRDTARERRDRAVLKVLFRLHSTLMFSWSKTGIDCSPEEFAVAWDGHLRTVNVFSRYSAVRRVTKLSNLMISDISPTLLFSVSDSHVAARAQSAITALV